MNTTQAINIGLVRWVKSMNVKCAQFPAKYHKKRKSPATISTVKLQSQSHPFHLSK